MHPEVGAGERHRRRPGEQRPATAWLDPRHRRGGCERGGGVGRGEGERARRSAERRQAIEHRTAAADQQLDAEVEPDRRGGEGGGGQPLAAAGPVEGGGREPGCGPDRPVLAARRDRLGGALDRRRVTAGAHQPQQCFIGIGHRRRRIGTIPADALDERADPRPRLPAPARKPLRLDRAPQPARLRRGRAQRGDGLRPRRGAGFYYLAIPDASPTRWFNGRTARLEESFRELTGAALEMRTFGEPEQGWEAARALIDGGRPALLLTDLYHLDYYGRSAHFPGHAVVLAGLRRNRGAALGHRLRGAAAGRPREPLAGPLQWPPRLSAERPSVHGRRRG